jgi:hypothetical protein
LEFFLPTIIDAVRFIGPTTATISEPRIKLLLHEVPTHMDMNDIRADIEEFCPNIKLGQTPRWLATSDNRKEKPFSTVVLAMVGAIILSSIGIRSFRVGNKMCSITTYIPFGPQNTALKLFKIQTP